MGERSEKRLGKFLQYWQEQFPHITPENSFLLLAVSGGADSTVLADLVYHAGFSFCIAHMNFQLRGQESVRDEIFVQSLAEKYACEVRVQHVDTEQYMQDHKLSVQEAARELRYNWFMELVREYQEKTGIKNIYLATAHHADDAMETMLMHFFRGTGIQGLTGIPVLQEERHIIRPLLGFRKKELQEYVKENSIGFVEDSSNAGNDYTRNFFRNTLLPQIKEVYPMVEQNLLYNIERFRDVAWVYKTTMEQQLKKLVVHKNGEWHIPVLKWKQCPYLAAVTWEIIRPYGFTSAQTAEVIRLLDAANGAYMTSASFRIIRNRNWMIMAPLATGEASHILIEENDNRIAYEQGILEITRSKASSHIPNNTQEALLDAGSITYPLLLRRWKQGDYFYPLGMQKKKKLSRFLIDLKLSKTEKENVWVIESDRRILWVVGYRIDHRFRITDSTSGVLHIKTAR